MVDEQGTDAASAQIVHGELEETTQDVAVAVLGGTLVIVSIQSDTGDSRCRAQTVPPEDPDITDDAHEARWVTLDDGRIHDLGHDHEITFRTGGAVEHGELEVVVAVG